MFCQHLNICHPATNINKRLYFVLSVATVQQFGEEKKTPVILVVTSALTRSLVSRMTPRRFSKTALGLGGIFGFSFNVVNATTVGIGLEQASSVDTDPWLDPVEFKVFGTVYVGRTVELSSVLPGNG